ncbi:unnamed protein product, partial [Iphiclides podalirius]
MWCIEGQRTASRRAEACGRDAEASGRVEASELEANRGLCNKISEVRAGYASSSTPLEAVSLAVLVTAATTSRDREGFESSSTLLEAYLTEVGVGLQAPRRYVQTYRDDRGPCKLLDASRCFSKIVKLTQVHAQATQQLGCVGDSSGRGKIGPCKLLAASRS